jgi:hypothetical protein
MFLLFVITKEKKYLEEAQRIAGSVEKYFTGTINCPTLIGST